MKILSNRTVDLTVAEQAASMTFSRLLDAGYDINQAASRVRELHRDADDPAFDRWLRGQPLYPTS